MTTEPKQLTAIEVIGQIVKLCDMKGRTYRRLVVAELQPSIDAIRELPELEALRELREQNAKLAAELTDANELVAHRGKALMEFHLAEDINRDARAALLKLYDAICSDCGEMKASPELVEVASHYAQLAAECRNGMEHEPLVHPLFDMEKEAHNLRQQLAGAKEEIRKLNAALCDESARRQIIAELEQQLAAANDEWGNVYAEKEKDRQFIISDRQEISVKLMEANATIKKLQPVTADLLRVQIELREANEDIRKLNAALDECQIRIASQAKTIEDFEDAVELWRREVERVRQLAAKPTLQQCVEEISLALKEGRCEVEVVPPQPAAVEAALESLKKGTEGLS